MNASCLCSSILAHFLSKYIFHNSKACVKCETQVSYKANLVTVSHTLNQPHLVRNSLDYIVGAASNSPVVDLCLPATVEIFAKFRKTDKNRKKATKIKAIRSR